MNASHSKYIFLRILLSNSHNFKCCTFCLNAIKDNLQYSANTTSCLVLVIQGNITDAYEGQTSSVEDVPLPPYNLPYVQIIFFLVWELTFWKIQGLLGTYLFSELVLKSSYSCSQIWLCQLLDVIQQHVT